MQELFENLKNIFKKDISILWIFSAVLGLALVALDLRNKLPLRAGDFAFISILILCVAMYRPRWVFYIFISLVPLENIILASGYLPLQLRPYQFVGAVLAIAISILWAARHLNFKLLKPAWLDWLVFSLVPLSFLPLITAQAKSAIIKNNLILFSFVVLYFLVRNFVRTKRHLLETVFFTLAGNLVVLAYGFGQVFADKFGRNSFEVFFGRPNAAFTEPDWLGIYLCFMLAILLSILYFLCHPAHSRKFLEKITNVVAYVLVFLDLTLLILTLSRSAWVGAAGLIFFFLIFSLYEKKNSGPVFTPKKFAKNFAAMVAIIVLSLAAVHFGRLSKFDIFDRARSTATSEQKITIACDNDENIPEYITDTSELSSYNCLHINLEDIKSFQSRGKYVTEIFRKDPNVATRSEIYQKSFEILKKNPLFGIGFGTISQTLGTDSRGSGLNESNIFLQVWAGTGVLGLTFFTVLLAYLAIFSLRRLSPACPLNHFIGCPVARGEFEQFLNVFLFLGLVGLILPNLFNAGLFMGIWWIGLGILTSVSKIQN
ncbi:MAG: O-antigen ligase family protein [Candidatus Moranbacteria bacterium]|nr:O-antigen ligase family protein [Candidatus Moranbacteria bacterium]